MRLASASWLTSPKTAEAVPPSFKIASTRLSTPPQFVSRSPGALCSLATPAGRTSETTTVTPLAASARAVELPMPIGFPQPVISATRDGWGMGFLLFRWCTKAPTPNPPPQAREGARRSLDCPPSLAGEGGGPSRQRREGGGLNRPRALELRPVHQAAARRIKRVAPVHRAAIVPPYQIADPPFLAPGESFLDGMRPEEIEQRLALRDREADDIGIDA